MGLRMKTRLLFVLLALGVVALAASAQGEEGKVSGVISGAHCGVYKMACAPDHDLRRAELPGVYTAENKFYVLTNVPQMFLAQWPVKEVTVEGTVYEEEKAIVAKKISVKEADKWRIAFEDGYIVDDMGHREKLATAIEKDGKWYCAICAKTHPKLTK